MHFCVSAALLYGGFSVPRKYGLNWFMPALVNSSVGSSRGTTGDDGTNVWPCFLTKKAMNCWRISFAVGIATPELRGGQVSTCPGPGPGGNLPAAYESLAPPQTVPAQI